MTPPIDVTEVDAPDPRRDDDGAVVLDWWVDLAGPTDAAAAEVVDALLDRHDRVRVRLRHSPSVLHVWAVAAAQCQVEAEGQGQGWAYAMHALAAEATIEGPADYVELAEHLGLDDEEVAAALFDGRHAEEVRREHDAGRALGVVATPTFVVDGLMVRADGPTEDAVLLELLSRRIGSALGR